MSLLLRLKRSFSRRDVFRLKPISAQGVFADSLPEPSDALDSSWNQYRCNAFLEGRARMVAYSCAAAVLAPLCWMRYRMNVRRRCERFDCDAYFYSLDHELDIVPESLRARYPRIVKATAYSFALVSEDVYFLLEVVRRHPFSPYFVLKSIMNVARYRAVLMQTEPEAILTCSDFSFTSALLTEWCRRRNISHIDVMHAEGGEDIRTGFVVFDEQYVWDEHAFKLYSQFHVDPNQFRIEAPPALFFSERDSSKAVDVTYYLGMEDERELRVIAASLKTLSDAGFSVCVRPHPRWTKPNLLSGVVGDALFIEDPREVDIAESVLRTRCAVSIRSSALTQAYFNGVAVMVDDVTKPDYFAEIREAGYRFAQEGTLRLSEVMQRPDVLRAFIGEYTKAIFASESPKPASGGQTDRIEGGGSDHG